MESVELVLRPVGSCICLLCFIWTGTFAEVLSYNVATRLANAFLKEKNAVFFPSDLYIGDKKPKQILNEINH